jgi:hypothetical protein
MTSDVRPCTAVRDSDLDTALKVVLSAAEGIVHDFPLKDDPEVCQNSAEPYAASR